MNQCKHCALPCPKDTEFCCPGCSQAYSLIHSSGLDLFYQRRSIQKNIDNPKAQDVPFFEQINNYIQHKENHLEIYLFIEGMHCAACGWVIEQVLQKQDYVTYARLNLTEKRLKVCFKETSNAQQIIKHIYTLGYKAQPYNAELMKIENETQSKQLLKALAIAGFGMMNVMLLSVALWSGAEQDTTTASLMRWFSALIALPTVAYSGLPFFRSAFNALKAKHLNMDVPISIAIILTPLYSLYLTIAESSAETYFDSAVALLFFLLIGRYLDTRMRQNVKQNSLRLLKLQNSFAKVKTATGYKMVNTQDLVKGDIILVTKGERVAADSILLDDIAELDNSLFTGESLPIAPKKGDELIGGALNIGGSFEAKVTTAVSEGLLQKMSELVNEASEAKNKLSRLSDRVAQYYAPVVHLLALITFVFWYAAADIHVALVAAVAVLIVTCPCALALSVPATQIAFTASLLRKAILLKNAQALENLHKIDAIVWDKTGTITQGRLKLISKISQKDLKVLASVAQHSDHPYAKALTFAYKKELHTAKHVKEHTGLGVQGQVEGLKVRIGRPDFCETTARKQKQLYARIDDKVLSLEFEDEIRPEASKAFKALNEYEHYLFSGDSKQAVERFNYLPFTEIKAELYPQEKLAELEKLKKTKTVAYVGDGINDAPSLANADVSISLSSGHDISQQSADIILQNNDLRSINYLLVQAKKARSVMLQNIGISLSYNLTAIPLAMAHIMSPIWAAVAMSVSSLIVMANALRVNKGA